MHGNQVERFLLTMRFLLITVPFTQLQIPSMFFFSFPLFFLTVICRDIIICFEHIIYGKHFFFPSQDPTQSSFMADGINGTAKMERRTKFSP